MGTSSRVDGRSDTVMRPLQITGGINPYTAGSAEVRLGNTLLLITVGVTATETAGTQPRIKTSIQILPHANMSGAQGEQELRSVELLCNRAFELSLGGAKLGTHALTLDCTVACADGGLATAAISGGWVALFQALSTASQRGQITEEIKLVRTAAITAGVVGPRILIDLAGPESSLAAFTSTFVFDTNKNLIAAAAQADKLSIAPAMFAQMLVASTAPVELVLKEQERAVLSLK